MTIDASLAGRIAFLESGLARWTSAEVEANAAGDEEYAALARGWARNYERVLAGLRQRTSASGIISAALEPSS